MKQKKNLIKVHITDNHPLVLDGFKAIFKANNIIVSGTSTNGLELIEWLEHNVTDVILLDISMPKMNGIDVLKYINENKIKEKVIIISSYHQLDFIEQTINNGAIAFLSKQFAGNEIVKAVHKVFKGETFFSIDIQEVLIKEYLSFKDNSNADFAKLMLEKSLSSQEMKILSLHAKKLTSEEISEELNISKSTIRSYRSRAREKLNIPIQIGLKLRLSYLKGE